MSIASLLGKDLIFEMDGEKLSYNDMGLKNDQWVFMESTRNGVYDTESNGSSCDEDSSILSSSSSDIQEEEDDATSSSSTSSSNSGPLFELSQLMDHLPIKRGLSKFYHGKSQSFTSLASVKSLEDLAKKENPYKKRVKPCNKFRPKGNITKKSSSRSAKRSNFVSLVGKRGTFGGTSSCRLAVSVVQKHF